MLPDYHCAEIPCDLDCNLFNQVIKDVVDLCYEAATKDVEAGGCTDLTGYITVDEPNNPIGNYIAGWNAGITPYNPRNSQAGAAQFFPRALMAVGVKLLETGWPVIENGNVPSMEDLSAMAQHSNAHSERITRALYNAVSRKTVLSSGCRFQGMGPMAPVAPQSGMVGWRWTVQLEVPW